MQEIVPGIFVEDRYPPYNVALVTLDEGALAVDVPPRPSHARRWLREAQEIAGVIRYVVLTDAQLDRLLGASVWDVPIVAGEATARYLKSLEEKEWQELLKVAQERYPEEASDIATLRRRRVMLAFDTDMYLYRREPPLELEAGAGAAPGSIWLFAPEEQVIFVGDTVAIDTPPVLEHTPDSKAWLNALGILANRASIQRIVPGRGPTAILRSELEPQREYLRVVRRSARSLARKEEPGAGIARESNELQQAFFPDLTKKSEEMGRIRRGLERLVEEEREARAQEAREAAAASAAEAEEES
jgi:glyoxylase-like metal-dependent hydrolase (beta-lactamase superfamily II)